MSALLSAQGLECRYPGLEEPVFQDLDFHVTAGESVAITGSSGSGKTTLLHVLGTLLTPTAGVLHIQGTDIASLDPGALSRLRNRSLGFLFQEHHLLPQCTALENTLLPALAGFADDPLSTLKERARELLRELGLEDRQNHRPGQLSGGERQRVALARAMLLRPPLLLADEPSGALDQSRTRALLEQLRRLQQAERTALVVVTHDPLVADAMDRVVALEGGALSPRGVPA
jgi:lipoprotein-releasing system ATP-binding protein